MLVKVAIIDDSFCPDIISKVSGIQKYIKYLSLNKHKKFIEKYKSMTLSHGTICVLIFIYELIKLNLLQHTELFCISIEDTSGKKSLNNLNRALYYCYKNNISLILMSIGTNNYAPELLPIIYDLNRKNAVLIAANSNDNSITYPAAFSNIIGVKISNKKDVIIFDNYIKDPIDGVNLTISRELPPIVNTLNKIYHLDYKMSNSFLVPIIGSEVAEFIYNRGYFCEMDLFNVLNYKSIELLDELPDEEDLSNKNKYNYIIVNFLYKNECNDTLLKFLIYFRDLCEQAKYSCIFIVDKKIYSNMIDHGFFYLPNTKREYWLNLLLGSIKQTSLVVVVQNSSDYIKCIDYDIEYANMSNLNNNLANVILKEILSKFEY
ncbi:MAG: hypothetical protein ACLS2V_11620 [Clostridium paraputrificum]